MIPGMFQLFGLPAGLRTRICLEAIPRRPSFRITIRRPFSSTSQYFKRAGISKPPAPAARPRRPPPPTTVVPPPSAPSSIIKRSALPSNTQDPVARLLEIGHVVLLYRAPSNHKSFVVLSITTATLLAFGAYTTVRLYFEELDDGQGGKVRIPYFVKAIGFIPAIFMAVISMRLFAGPSSIMRTITLVGPHVEGLNARAQPILRCEALNPLPWMPKKIIEASPGRLFASKKMVVPDPKADATLRWRNIPISDSPEFTRSEFDTAVKAMWKRKVPSLANLWPTAKLQVRRMMLREGFHDIRFPEGGTWKMDLTGAEVLENCLPIAAVTTNDAQKLSFFAQLLRFMT